MKKKSQRFLSFALLLVMLFSSIGPVFANTAMESIPEDNLDIGTFLVGHYHNNVLTKDEPNQEKFTEVLKELGIITLTEQGKPAFGEMTSKEFKETLGADGVFPGFVQKEKVEGATRYYPIHHSKFAIEKNGEKTPIFCISYGKPSLAKAVADGKKVDVRPIEELKDLGSNPEEKIAALQEVLYLFNNDEEILKGYTAEEREWVAGLAMYVTAERFYDKDGSLVPLEKSPLEKDRIVEENLLSKVITDEAGKAELLKKAQKMVDDAYALKEKAYENVASGDAAERNTIGLAVSKDAKYPAIVKTDAGAVKFHFTVNEHDFANLTKENLQASIVTLDNQIAKENVAISKIKGYEGDGVMLVGTIDKIDNKPAADNFKSAQVKFHKDVVTQSIFKEDSEEYQEMLISNIDQKSKAINIEDVFEFNLKKVDKDDKNITLPGASFSITMDGVEFPVKTYTTDKDGVINAELPKYIMNDKNFKGIIIKEVKAPTGYEDNGEAIFIAKDIIANEKSYTIEVENKKITKGSRDVEFSKTQFANSEGVPGAHIRLSVLKDGKYDVVADEITGKDGKIVFKDLKPGQYKFEETLAPEGFLKTTETIEFTINEDLSISNNNIVMKNAVLKDFVFSKQDEETKKGLAGAEFDLFKLGAGQPVKLNDASIVSDAKGDIVVNIIKEAGSYKLKETKAPEGYTAPVAELDFKVANDGSLEVAGETVDKPVINNKKLGDKVVEVVLNKTDLTTGKPVEGAVIEVSSKDVEGFETVTVISDAKGTMNLILDKVGKYQFKETIAPNGYILNEEVFEFEVYEKDGKLHVKGDNTITNEPDGTPTEPKLFDIKLEKRSSGTEQKLSGYKFDLVNAEGKVIREVVGDDEEAVVIKELPAGDYKLVETEAPKGYIVLNRELAFSIDEEGKLTADKEEKLIRVDEENEDTLIVLNRKFNVSLFKIDGDTGELLQGATFVVKKDGSQDDGVIVVSEEDGKISISEAIDEPGEYLIEETLAPEGYSKLAEAVRVIVHDDGSYEVVGNPEGDFDIENFKIDTDEPIDEDDPEDEDTTKPDGEDYEEELEDEPEDDEYEEVEYDDDDVVVDQVVKTGEDMKNFATIRNIILLLSVAFIFGGVIIKRKDIFKK